MGERDSLSPPTVQPVLPVDDMGAGVGFYERLGFDVDRFDSNYSIVGYSGHELFHLQVNVDLDRDSNPTSMHLRVPDADRWHKRWHGAGVSVGEIANRDWGMREFSLTDPAGNTLRVGTNL